MATQTVSLSSGGFVNCGPGPLALISQAGPLDVLIYSNATSPAQDSDASAVLIEAKKPLNYQFTDNLWVKLVSGSVAISVRVIK